MPPFVSTHPDASEADLQRLREAFLAVHGDLLGVDFWHARQAAIRAGVVIDLFPYTSDQRLRADIRPRPLS